MPKERIRFACPRNHVIYNPSISAGASAGLPCQRSKNDCIGEAAFLQSQVDKCHWRKSCDVKIYKNDSIICGTNRRKCEVSQHIDYVVIRQPYCINKNILTDICSRKKRHQTISDSSVGLIRSHSRYPRERSFHQKTCNITIKIRKTKTLLLSVFRNDKKCARHSYNVKVYTAVNGSQSEVDIRTSPHKMTFTGNVTDSIIIVADFSRSKRKCRGFIIPFTAYSSKSLDKLMTLPKQSRSVMTANEQIFEVRAVIEQCIVQSTGLITLTCGPGQVIYSPEISASGYTAGKPRCIFGQYPCGGYTPGILIQRTSCYWQNTCNVTWEGSDRIILSKRINCIGYSASTLGLSGHQCVHKDIIFDLCTNITKHITTDWGIIRSHATYPWNFDTEFAECKRILKIGKGHVLSLTVQDMNLDPDGRDKFGIYHAIRRSRIILMDSKSAKEGHHIMVEGGRLVIMFKPYPVTKAGRGFVLVFRKQKAHKKKFDLINGNMQAIGDEAMSDGTVLLRMSNRRLCSGSSQDRKRGTACKPRVWTDFFTRLE